MNITEITRLAKEHLLHEKQYTPMLWVEFQSGNEAHCPFIGFPGMQQEQQRLLFAVGRMLGTRREYRHEEIKQLCLIHEAWGSLIEPGDGCPHCHPMQEMRRLEFLLIHVLDIIPPQSPHTKPSLQQYMQVVEMLRDGSGDLVDLLPRTEQEMGVIVAELLECAVAGFLSTRMPARKLHALIGRVKGRAQAWKWQGRS